MNAIRGLILLEKILKHTSMFFSLFLVAKPVTYVPGSTKRDG